MTTIQKRLTVKLLIVWSVLLVVGAGVAWLTARTALTRQFDDGLRTKAMALSAIIEQDPSGIQVDLGDQFLREFDTNKASFFMLWSADGKEVARSDSLGKAALPFQSAGSEAGDVRLESGIAARAVTIKFQPHAADAPEQSGQLNAILVVAADRRELDQALVTVALALAGSGLLVLILTGAAVPWLLRRELKPLNQLAEQTERITAESLSERFSTEGLPGELAPIGARLNDLLQRLETSFVRERQFSDDLAHEFRTPIAELRSLAELSLKWPDARSAEADQHALTIAQQMEGMINRLLAIARSTQGQAPTETQRVELAALVSTVCQPLEQTAKTRHVSIESTVPESLSIQSDPVLMRSIMTNLLDNAVEYSAERGTVKILSGTQNGHFTLHVTNPVQELKAEDVPRLFDRFWRKDPARSGGEHTGLGLPLARALAASLGYTLTAALNGDAGLTMTLSGPVKQEPQNQTTKNTKHNENK